MAQMQHPEGLSLQDQAERLRKDAGQPPPLPVRHKLPELASILRVAVTALLVMTAMAVVVSRGARHRTAGWIVEAAEFFRGSRRDVAVLEPIRRGPVASQPLELGKPGEVSGLAGRRTAPQSVPRFVLAPPAPSPTPSWVIVPPEEQNAEPAAPVLQISGDVKERAIALLKRDPVAGKLMANQIAGYSYVDSEIVSHEENIVRVRVTARVQGEEKKLTWEVNLDNGQTRPLSYEARKLTP